MKKLDTSRRRFLQLALAAGASAPGLGLRITGGTRIMWTAV